MPFPPRYLSHSPPERTLPHSSFPFPSPPLLTSTIRYQTPLSIFCERIPDFLIAINVRSDRRPLSPHLHAVMYPLLVFPALSSAFIPPTLLLPRRIFHDFSSIEIDACLFASLSPPSQPYQLFFRSSFSEHNPLILRYSPDICLIFAGTVDFRAPACAALMCICVSILLVPFSPLLCPVCHPIPPPPRCLSQLFRHNWYPHAVVAASYVTFLPAYVSISHRFSSHFLPTINTLSHSVYMLLAKWLRDLYKVGPPPTIAKTVLTYWKI